MQEIHEYMQIFASNIKILTGQGPKGFRNWLQIRKFTHKITIYISLVSDIVYQFLGMDAKNI